MFCIYVSRDALKIPIKIFYLLLLTCGVLSLLVLEVLKRVDAGRRPACIKIPQEKRTRLRYISAGLEHTACSKDPFYHNTWESCPLCFRPMARIHSTHITEIPRNVTLFPRGPQGYFKPRKTKQQDIVYNTLISPTSVCVDIACPYLVTLQLSVTDRVRERNAIRSTWGSVAKTKLWPHANVNADTQLLFVLGHQSSMSETFAARVDPVERLPDSGEWKRIQSEANRHGDILYLDMIDSYYNLTLKLMSALSWVRYHCPRTKFFLKADADTFINVPLLVDLLMLNEDLLKRSVTGHVYTGDRHVFRNGRWGVSKELYPPPMFPVYASGCAYVISRSALVTMTTAGPYVPLIPIEDAFITGILGRIARVQYFSLPDVFTHFKDFYWQRCQMVLDAKVAGSNAGGARAKDIWSAIVGQNQTCFEEDNSSGYEAYYKLIVVDE